MAAVEKKYVGKVPQNEVREIENVNSFYDGYIQGIEDLLRSIRQEKIAGGEVGGKIN